MACMEHECANCGELWMNNKTEKQCPKCGSTKISNFFDESWDSFDYDMGCIFDGKEDSI